MKTELARLELTKTQIASLKDSLIDIPIVVYNKDWTVREANMKKLDFFLANNNCSEVPPEFKDVCYIKTRRLLIATTKELDASNDQINSLNQVVDHLTGNISSVIDAFSAPTPAVKK